MNNQEEETTIQCSNCQKTIYKSEKCSCTQQKDK